MPMMRLSLKTVMIVFALAPAAMIALPTIVATTVGGIWAARTYGASAERRRAAGEARQIRSEVSDNE